MKKIISIIAASAVSAAMSVSAFAVGMFSDLDDSRYDWARDNIERMADLGYITGYEDGTFKPDQNITKLECIALFARAMGSSDEANAEVLRQAHATYDDLISDYYLTWGQDEIVYMLYKGALTKSDLDTYIKDVKDEPMQRYEAAIIITKAMGGEEEALDEVAIDLEYLDVNDIPRNAMQYVNYVTNEGIMTGMDGNRFEPLSPVLRSQMATMLARVVDATEYEYISGKLMEINTENQTITIRDTSGDTTEYNYTDNTQFSIQGISTQLSSMIVNVNANITLSNGEVILVDATASEPDETITGRYQGYQLSGAGTVIKMIPNNSTDIEQYTCSESLSVTYEGSPATLRSFSTDDVITLELEDGLVVNVIGQEKTQVIQGAEVVSVNVGDQLTITISHAQEEYDGMTYPVSSDVTVRKNGVSSDMASLYPGDTISELELEYGEVTRIVASASTRTYQGTVQSVNISTESSMVVRVEGEDMSFVIPNDVTITINGEEGTLYDFRVGDVVTITTESGAITRIVSSGTTASEGRISGTVTSINTSYGFLRVLVDGSDTAETVFFRSSNVTVVTSAGVSQSVSDIEVGDVVDTRCTFSNGAYTAKLIIIEEDA